MKIADGAWVRKNTNPVFFQTNLDAFGGNSGSPVLNSETGEVEGILVRGEIDYSYDSRGCRVPKFAMKTSAVERMLLELLKQII